MPMLVCLAQEQRSSHDHQKAGNQEKWSRDIGEDEKRKNRSDEWRSAEQSGCPCRTQIPERPDEQSDAESVAHAAQEHRRHSDSHGREGRSNAQGQEEREGARSQSLDGHYGDRVFG